MPIQITLPRLGWSMEEGKFLAWLKKEGDFVKEGEPLFTLESDKAAQDVESIDSGILSIPTHGPKSGDIIKVGHIIGYLLGDGESAPMASAPPEQAKAEVTPPRPEQSKTDPPATAILAPATSSAGVAASPRARRAAKEHHVNLSTLKASGKGGRIRERDVLVATKAFPSPGDGQKIPLTSMRRAIAARLMHSRQITVPVTITSRCDVTALLAFRQQLKSAAEKSQLPVTPTLNDLFLKLTARALRQHPMLTATWEEDHLLLPGAIHLGVAVDAGDGLLVPVIRDVDARTLTEVASQSQRLITAARVGQLSAADMQGACFTVSNLGGLGVEAFTPVINPPESAILGIGAIVREAVPLDNGGFAARDRLMLSLTFDHRVNDGAAAARFLQTLRQIFENPLLGLV